MFNKCDFLVGRDKSLVIMVPNKLPKLGNITIRVFDQHVQFVRHDGVVIGCVEDVSAKILRCLSKKTRVGLIEAINGQPPSPMYISAIANVEVGTNFYLKEIA